MSMGSFGAPKEIPSAIKLADENSFRSNLGSYEQNRQIRTKKFRFANYMHLNTFNKIVIASNSKEASEQQCWFFIFFLNRGPQI